MPKLKDQPKSRARAKARVKIEKNELDKIMQRAEEEKPVSISDMPLKTLGDYVRYNTEARKLNHKLGLCRYPIKQCPIELHPTERIIFGRKDQPSNPLPVYLSNDMIDFKKQLVPGETYDLPRCIVEYLAAKGTAIWQWYDKPDGSRDTRISHRDPRFAIRTLYDKDD